MAPSNQNTLPNVRRIITLPNGRPVTLGEYAKAWRTLQAAEPAEEYKGFAHTALPAWEILAAIRHGIHDRINRHLPWYDHGRNWDQDRQRHMAMAARNINTPLLTLHRDELQAVPNMPPALWSRLADRVHFTEFYD